MEYLAHIRDTETQTVAEHCKATAQYAAEKAPTGMYSTVYLAGLTHDAGKYCCSYQDYIRKAANGENPKRGSVNHTFAGVRYILERWHRKDRSPRDITCELLAVAAGSHHGLFDCMSPKGEDGYVHRLQKDGISYDEAKSNFINACADEDELDKLFAAAEQEVSAFLGDMVKLLGKGQPATQYLFYTSMMGRMLLSSVIDGDRRDTAEFMNNTKLYSPPKDMAVVWEDCLNRVNKKLSQFSSDSKINMARQSISQQCCDFQDGGNGIYRLSVPTGGGKTLTSLKYALTTALKYSKKRILFAIPLLSVLEQNAKTIREFIGDDSLILEHHSNIINQKPNTDEKYADEFDENELLIDTWESPLVITTLVQLLNTLFEGKTSCIRRMSALSDSVIIIDEVQSVPRKLISMFNLALNFLAYSCKATVVLCSATQPCFEEVAHPVIYAEPADLVPYDADLWYVFRRTAIIDKRKKDAYSAQELADFAVECANEQGSALVICNTKAQARDTFNALPSSSGLRLFHLSTSMCMQHRIEVMAEIKANLRNEVPIICISTQLAEAGIDFSFACVIRVSAGIDNVVQAAGRCNRSGELGRICHVYIVNFKDENLSHLKDIRLSQIAAESVLLSYRNAPEKFDGDLASEQAVRAYYRQLYREMNDDELDYPIPEPRTTLLNLLSANTDFAHRCPSVNDYIMRQAFATAGSEFSVFEDNTLDVLVPFGGGEELIAGLGSERVRYDFAYRAELIGKLKPYCVSIYEHEKKRLSNDEIKEYLDGAVLALTPGFYNENTGFDINSAGKNNSFLEG